MGLKEWWEKRRMKKEANEWCEYERNRLEVLTWQTNLKTARVNLQLQRFQFRELKKEHKRKPKYVT